jgi:hypothetical protein
MSGKLKYRGPALARIRKAICWAPVPVGMNAAAGLPKIMQIRTSSAVTTPPSL